jgi:hypothetical protein
MGTVQLVAHEKVDMWNTRDSAPIVYTRAPATASWEAEVTVKLDSTLVDVTDFATVVMNLAAGSSVSDLIDQSSSTCATSSSFTDPVVSADFALARHIQQLIFTPHLSTDMIVDVYVGDYATWSSNVRCAAGIHVIGNAALATQTETQIACDASGRYLFIVNTKSAGVLALCELRMFATKVTAAGISVFDQNGDKPALWVALDRYTGAGIYATFQVVGDGSVGQNSKTPNPVAVVNDRVRLRLVRQTLNGGNGFYFGYYFDDTTGNWVQLGNTYIPSPVKLNVALFLRADSASTVTFDSFKMNWRSAPELVVDVYTAWKLPYALQSVALDPAARVMYFGTSMGYAYRAPMEPAHFGQVQQITSKGGTLPGQVTSIVLYRNTSSHFHDTCGHSGDIYWTERDANAIHKSKIDGSLEQILHHTSAVNTEMFGFKLDLDQCRLYASDLNTRRVVTLNADGSNLTQLVTHDDVLDPQMRVFGIDFDSNELMIYFADYENHKIYRSSTATRTFEDDFSMGVNPQTWNSDFPDADLVSLYWGKARGELGLIALGDTNMQHSRAKAPIVWIKAPAMQSWTVEVTVKLDR